MKKTFLLTLLSLLFVFIHFKIYAFSFEGCHYQKKEGKWCPKLQTIIDKVQDEKKKKEITDMLLEQRKKAGKILKKLKKTNNSFIADLKDSKSSDDAKLKENFQNLNNIRNEFKQHSFSTFLKLRNLVPTEQKQAITQKYISFLERRMKRPHKKRRQ